MTVHYMVSIDTYENEAPYFTYDWTGKEIEDETLLELIKHENILVTPYRILSDEVRNLVEGGLKHYQLLILVNVKLN